MESKTLILFLIVFIFVNPKLNAQIPTSGLIAYYPFNGNTNDESGNNNHGVNHGAQLTTDRFGNPNSAYYFDGDEKYISVQSSPSLTSPTNKVTMVGWAMVTGPSLRHYILDKRLNFDTSSPFDSYMLLSAIESQALSWQSFVSPSTQTVTATSTFNENIWTFVVGVYNGINLDIYVDGILEGSVPCTGNITYSDYPLYIGAGGLKPSHYMNGKIDDIRIYNRILTPEEILILFNEHSSQNPIIEGPQEVCSGEVGVNYIVSNMDSIQNYSWNYSGNGVSSTGFTNNLISFDFAKSASSGTLTIAGIRADNRVDTARIEIVVNPIPLAVASNNSPVCEGSQIYLSAQSVSGGSYNWTGPNGYSSTVQNSIIYPASDENEGVYYLAVLANGCMSVPTLVEIEVNNCGNDDLSILKIINKTDPLVGESVIFTIVASNIGSSDVSGVRVEDVLQSGYTYISSTTSMGEYNPGTGIWTIGTLGSGSTNNLIIIALVNPTGSYINTASIQGSTNEINLNNNFSTVRAIPFYFNIPNSFSPNGDGINDAFVISGLNDNSKLLIFNRFGVQIYHSENYQNDWFGKDSKGNILNSDTYWYFLTIPGIPTEFKGFVYLKK